jgi:hypothetical protein
MGKANVVRVQSGSTDSSRFTDALKCVSVNCHLWACEVTKFWLLDCSDAWFVWQGL